MALPLNSIGGFFKSTRDSLAFGTPILNENFKLKLVDFLKLVIIFVYFSKK